MSCAYAEVVRSPAYRNYKRAPIMMATPVRRAIHPRAQRVRVPRDRPGIRPAKHAPGWPQLRQLASFRSAPAGT